MPLDLSPAQSQAFELIENELEQLGFGVMKLSGRTVAIKSIPTDLPASEVAAMLDTTVPAVKSALQRARARLDQVDLGQQQIDEPTDPHARALLGQYMAGFEYAEQKPDVASQPYMSTFERIFRREGQSIAEGVWQRPRPPAN